jgi:uncharacterized protein
MPVIKNKTYKAPYYLFSKHLQTILPALFRRVGNVVYTRERINTPDNDFLDLDWSLCGSETLVVISHGLEGDSNRPYVLGMVRALNMNNLDALAWNYRGCSGEMNKVVKMYHSGETSDLNEVINHVLQTKSYEKIILIGFSVGGNITLKYLGEQNKIPEKIKGAICFSVPCHLESGAMLLAKFKSRIYMQRFLKSLHKKIKSKAIQWPDAYSDENFLQIKNFLEFDSIYTAPINGFKDAYDYWKQNSSIFFIEKITTPTLIVSALNDPFLAPECFPIKEAENNPFVTLEITREGGHCGFYSSDDDGIYWSEKRAIEFIANFV